MATERWGSGITLPIDLRFRSIGRIHVRSGTYKKQVRDAMKQMCRTLYQIGRRDILRDIAAGTVDIQEVYERFRMGRMDQLPSGALLKPLESAWAEWLAQKEIAASTSHDYTKALDRLKASGATVGDLPRLIQAHRVDSRGKHPRSFNKDRYAVLSFLRTLVGAHHWIYGEVARSSPLKIPEAVKMEVNPLTVEQAKTLAGKLPPRHLFSFWGLCLTGMRPEEWFEQGECRWKVEGQGIRVLGYKRPASKRVVPKVGEIVKPLTGRLAFYRALRKASGYTVAPYDLRRTYAVWLELAGIPTYRQDYYMAHGPKDLNALYKRQRECLPHLEGDAVLLDQLVKSPQKSPQSGGR